MTGILWGTLLLRYHQQAQNSQLVLVSWPPYQPRDNHADVIQRIDFTVAILAARTARVYLLGDRFSVISILVTNLQLRPQSAVGTWLEPLCVPQHLL